MLKILSSKILLTLECLLLTIFLLPIEVLGVEQYFLENDIATIKNAVRSAEKKDWDGALNQAKIINDPIVSKAIYWLKLTTSNEKNDFDKLVKFYKEVQSWPNSNVIRVKVEESITPDIPKNIIIDWFTAFPPQSSTGNKLFLQASYEIYGIDQKVISLAKSCWVKCNFSVQEEIAFLNNYATHLNSNDHISKIDRLIWSGRFDEAIRNMHRVNEDHQRLFRARLALINEEPGIDGFLNRVPTRLHSDPGLLYDRLIWNEKRDNFDNIISLAAEIPSNPPNYSKWWDFKSRQIRSMIERKQYHIAYRITSSHKNKAPAKYAEAEWLAGWIALRYLNSPKLAKAHFQNITQVVKLPVSVARANYWVARAFEASSDKNNAKEWYKKAANFPSTFYGQLALLKINNDGNFSIDSNIAITIQDQKQYQNNIYAKLAFIFSFYKDYEIAKQFIVMAIDNAKSNGEIALIAQMGMKIKKYDLAIEAAKNALAKKVFLPNIGYPKIKIENNGDVEQAFIHALIRQESLFNVRAESKAGALGLMQIMPDTGRLLAKSLNAKFDVSRLKNDFKYNMKLGIHNLNKLLRSYRGSYILTAAAYNAGEYNVREWIKRFGDPREMKTIEEVIDWIELITFYETRNYVQRILESTQIYRSILNQSSQFKTILNQDVTRTQN